MIRSEPCWWFIYNSEAGSSIALLCDLITTKRKLALQIISHCLPISQHPSRPPHCNNTVFVTEGRGRRWWGLETTSRYQSDQFTTLHSPLFVSLIVLLRFLPRKTVLWEGLMTGLSNWDKQRYNVKLYHISLLSGFVFLQLILHLPLSSEDSRKMGFSFLPFLCWASPGVLDLFLRGLSNSRTQFSLHKLDN